MPDAVALPRPPRPRPVHPPHRRHARRRRRSACAPTRRLPLGDAFCSHMAEDRGAAPAATTSAATPSTRALADAAARAAPRSYLGVPLELSDGTRVGSLAALSRTPQRASPPPTSSCSSMLARVLASELERESQRARPAAASTTCCATRPAGMGAIGRVAKALAGGDDARPAVCEAACEVTGAPVAFLLEPSRPRLRLDRDGRRRHRAGDDPAARRRRVRRPRVHRQGDLLRRRRAQPPGAGRAAGRGDRRALGACSSRCCATARSPAC